MKSRSPSVIVFISYRLKKNFEMRKHVFSLVLKNKIVELEDTQSLSQKFPDKLEIKKTKNVSDKVDLFYSK